MRWVRTDYRHQGSADVLNTTLCHTVSFVCSARHNLTLFPLTHQSPLSSYNIFFKKSWHYARTFLCLLIYREVTFLLWVTVLVGCAYACDLIVGKS